VNKRIKELAIKAGMYIVDDEFSTYGKFAEKFAELLVRECCQKLEDDGMVEVAIEMKQHFGVDGMSTEDKKTLIKELLGVKND